MLSSIKHHHTQSTTVKQEQHQVIQHGDMMIGPEIAQWVLDNCFYKGQEARMRTGRLSILRHVVRLRRGRWLAGSQIAFCRTPDGKLTLVNGYHRMNAIIQYGLPASFNVQIYDVNTSAEINARYSLFDRAKDSRIRPPMQANNALNVAGRLELSSTAAKQLIATVLLIQNGLRPIRPGDREALVEFDSLEDRIDLAEGWKKEAKALDDLYYRIGMEIKRKLFSPSVFSVALITMRHQQMKASIFWGAVANNDGLRKGTPEHTLVQWLLTYRMDPGTPDGIIAAALAWNAFFQGRSLRSLKIENTVGFRLAGTPIDVKGRK